LPELVAAGWVSLTAASGFDRFSARASGFERSTDTRSGTAGACCFGSFSVSKRAARKGRNPATGAAITIKASKNVRFKAGKELKDALNKGR